MRAAILVDKGKMECQQAEMVALEDGDVLVKTELAAICGSDLHVVFDGMFYLEPQHRRPGFPGHEGLGEVVESKYPALQVGAKVLTCPVGPHSGCFAEYQTLPGNLCVPLPHYNGPMMDLLMAQQMGTTIFALRKDPADMVGKTVMVMGQGSAGVFFGYMAKRMGAAKVIVSDKSEARLAVAHLTGADVALKADDDDGGNVREAVMEHTNGQGADYVIEAVGRQKSLLQSVDLARENGDLLLFGLPDTREPVRFNYHDFFRKKLRANSIYGTQHEHDRVSFKMALDIIATGQIDVSKMVSHTVPIEGIQKGMNLAQYRNDGARKIAVSF